MTASVPADQAAEALNLKDARIRNLEKELETWQHRCDELKEESDLLRSTGQNAHGQNSSMQKKLDDVSAQVRRRD